MIKTLPKPALAATLVLGMMSAPFASAAAEYNGWENLTAGNFTTGDLTAGITANAAGSGDATMTRLSGGHYPASSALYSFSSPSTFELTDSTAAADVGTISFSILTWANPDYGDGSSPAGSIGTAPTLDYNAGTQALAADSVTSAYYGPFSGGGFDVDSYLYTYAWDVSSLGITAFDIEWEQIVHTGVLSVELNQVSAVPVPAAAWLFGSAILGLVGIGRKRQG